MLFKSIAAADVTKALANLRMENKKRQEEMRGKIIDYYENCQQQYLKNWGFEQDDGKWIIPPAWYNITSKIINKISLGYKYPPDRRIDETKDDKEDVYSQWFAKYPRFNLALKSAERFKNALHRVLFRPVYDTENKKWKPLVETDYYPHFLEDDPLNPVAYSIPIKQDVEKSKPEDERFIFWSKEQYFIHDRNGKQYLDEFNGINPFGIIPLVEMRKDLAVNQYECSGAIDLVQANESINIAMMNLNMMIHFQAFDQPWENSGMKPEDWKTMKTGPEKMWHFPEGSTASLLGFSPKITECVEAVRSSMQMISEMYNVKMQWSIDGSAVSGFSLIVQNIDLLEAREDDIDISKIHEKELFDVLSKMQSFYRGRNEIEDEPILPDKADLLVDFQEWQFPVNQAEEQTRWDWEIKQNASTVIDYIQSKNPDMSDEEALAKYEENKKTNGRLSNIDKMREELKIQGGAVIPEIPKEE